MIRGLIREFRVNRVYKSCNPKSAQWRFWPVCANVQANLNLCWAHMSEGTVFWRCCLNKECDFIVERIILSIRIIHIQLTLVISNSKGLYETLRDIRSSTYQIYGTEEKQLIEQPPLTEWIRNLTPKLEIYWKYCGKEEKLLLRSDFSSFSQYFIDCW